MQTKQPRLVLAGSLLLAFAIAFALFMMSIASQSRDPAELMRIVGVVAGTVGGLAVMLIVLGVRRKTARA